MDRVKRKANLKKLQLASTANKRKLCSASGPETKISEFFNTPKKTNTEQTTFNDLRKSSEEFNKPPTENKDMSKKSEIYKDNDLEDENEDKPKLLKRTKLSNFVYNNSEEVSEDIVNAKKRISNNDFEVAERKIKKAPKIKTSKSKSSEGRGKKQQTIQSAFLRNEQIFGEIAAQHSIAENFSPDEVQMALALSKSEAEAKGIISETVEHDTIQIIGEKDGVSKSHESIRSKLQKYGFRTSAKQDYSTIVATFTAGSNRKIKTKWANKFTTLTLRNPEYQLKKVKDKVDLFLKEQNLTIMGVNSNLEDEPLLPYRFLSRGLNKVFIKDRRKQIIMNESEEILNVNLEKYFVTDLFSISDIRAGYLLKNWKMIQGRDLSPNKHDARLKEKTKILQNLYKELETVFMTSSAMEKDPLNLQTNLGSDDINLNSDNVTLLEKLPKESRIEAIKKESEETNTTIYHNSKISCESAENIELNDCNESEFNAIIQLIENYPDDKENHKDHEASECSKENSSSPLNTFPDRKTRINESLENLQNSFIIDSSVPCISSNTTTRKRKENNQQLDDCSQCKEMLLTDQCKEQFVNFSLQISALEEKNEVLKDLNGYTSSLTQQRSCSPDIFAESDEAEDEVETKHGITTFEAYSSDEVKNSSETDLTSSKYTIAKNKESSPDFKESCHSILQTIEPRENNLKKSQNLILDEDFNQEKSINTEKRLESKDDKEQHVEKYSKVKEFETFANNSFILEKDLEHFNGKLSDKPNEYLDPSPEPATSPDSIIKNICNNSKKKSLCNIVNSSSSEEIVIISSESKDLSFSGESLEGTPKETLSFIAAEKVDILDLSEDTLSFSSMTDSIANRANIEDHNSINCENIQELNYNLLEDFGCLRENEKTNQAESSLSFNHTEKEGDGYNNVLQDIENAATNRSFLNFGADKQIFTNFNKKTNKAVKTNEWTSRNDEIFNQLVQKYLKKDNAKTINSKSRKSISLTQYELETGLDLFFPETPSKNKKNTPNSWKLCSKIRSQTSFTQYNNEKNLKKSNKGDFKSPIKNKLSRLSKHSLEDGSGNSWNSKSSDISIDLTQDETDNNEDEDDCLMLSDDEINYSIWKANKSAHTNNKCGTPLKSTEISDDYATNIRCCLNNTIGKEEKDCSVLDLLHEGNEIKLSEIFETGSCERKFFERVNTDDEEPICEDNLFFPKKTCENLSALKSSSNKSFLRRNDIMKEFGILESCSELINVSQLNDDCIKPACSQSENIPDNWEEASFMQSPSERIIIPFKRKSDKFDNFYQISTTRSDLSVDNECDEFDILVSGGLTTKFTKTESRVKTPTDFDQLLNAEISFQANTSPSYTDNINTDAETKCGKSSPCDYSFQTDYHFHTCSPLPSNSFNNQDSSQKPLAVNSIQKRPKSSPNLLSLEEIASQTKICSEKQSFKEPQNIELNGRTYTVQVIKEEKPDFTKLSEAELFKRLYNFGIKPLQRKQAVKLLEFIYNQTHPVLLPETNLISEVPFQEIGNNKACFLESSPTISDIESFEDNITDNLFPNINGNEAVNKKFALTNTFGYQILKFKSELFATLVDGDEEYIFQTNITKKTPQPLLPFHIAWHNLICSHTSLHEAVIMYKAVDLQEIYLFLKSLGLRYDPKDMRNFFDRRCIIFRYDLHPSSKDIDKNRHVRKSRNNSKKKF